jgi:hypothetical protein
LSGKEHNVGDATGFQIAIQNKKNMVDEATRALKAKDGGSRDW